MSATPRRMVFAGAAGLIALAMAGCGAVSHSAVTPAAAQPKATSGTGSATQPQASASGGADRRAQHSSPVHRPAHDVADTKGGKAAPSARPATVNPDGPEPLPSPAPGVPTGPGTVVAATLDPCTLVSTADAGRVLGAPASKFTPEQEPDDTDEFTACGYRTADHERKLLVDIAIDQNAVYSFDSYWGPGAAGGPMGAVSTRIPHLGDKAYELVFTKDTGSTATRNLGVVSHGVVLELHASNDSGAAASRTVLVAAARAAVSRLP